MLSSCGRHGHRVSRHRSRARPDRREKIPLDRFAADGHFLARFRQEARAAAGLNHPNNVAVFDSGADGETHLIVMEYVPGRTLAEALATRSPYAVERALEIGEAVAEALQAAHDQGLIHRDVKPGNIMLTPNGTVKVMDFGIARATADDRHTDRSCAHTDSSSVRTLVATKLAW